MTETQKARRRPRRWQRNSMRRSPDEIRDASVKRFNKLAAMKFDAGQAEHKECLDESVTFAHLEEEIIDLWFYVQSMKAKIDGSDAALREYVIKALPELRDL